MNQRKIKVLFFLHTKFTNTFDDLYQLLRNDNRFECAFIVSEFQQKNTIIYKDKIAEICDKKGYNYIFDQNEKGEVLNLRSLNPDYIFFQTPYPEQWNYQFSPSIVSEFCKVLYISYGAAMIDYEGTYDKHFSYNSFFCNCSAVFVENTLLYNFFKKFIPDKVLPIGYIKVLKKAISERKTTQVKLRKSVVWKPRWTLTPGDSNFSKYIYYLIEYFCDKPETDFYIYLHTLFTGQIVEGKIISIKEWNKILKKINNTPNIHIFENDEDINSILGFDILISDPSSTIPEFMLTGKPVIFTPNDYSLNFFGRIIEKGLYTVETYKKMGETIENLINGDDPLLEERNQLFGKISDGLYLGMSPEEIIKDYLLKNARMLGEFNE